MENARLNSVRRRNTRRSPFAAVAMAVIAMLALPSLALAGPATNEYLLDLPDAKGKQEGGESPGSTGTGALSAKTAKELAGDAEGRTLAQLATAEELGAPGEPGSTSTEQADAIADDGESSTLAAAVGAFDDPAIAGMTLALLAIAGLIYFTRRNRTDSEPDER